MTDAERELLVYIARMLVARANPDGEIAATMQTLLDRILAEQSPPIPEKTP